MGGLMSVTGPKGGLPTRAGNAMGDILGGMNLAIGILAAVNARNLTGEGQRVDISLVDSVVASLENAFERYFYSGQLPERLGNAYASVAPYDTYEAKDGYVVIACGNQKLYEELCREVLHMPDMIDDERFLTVPLRVKNSDVQKPRIESWTKKYTVAEVVRMVSAHGIPASPIYDLKQIVEAYRGMISVWFSPTEMMFTTGRPRVFAITSAFRFASATARRRASSLYSCSFLTENITLSIWFAPALIAASITLPV